MQNYAPTIYAYASLEALFEGETAGGGKIRCPVRSKAGHRTAYRERLMANEANNRRVTR